MKPPAPETLVDLARPPAERWTFSEEQVRSGRDLFRIYNHDIGIDEATRQEAMSLATALIPEALVDDVTLDPVLAAKEQVDQVIGQRNGEHNSTDDH